MDCRHLEGSAIDRMVEDLEGYLLSGLIKTNVLDKSILKRQ